MKAIINCYGDGSPMFLGTDNINDADRKAILAHLTSLSPLRTQARPDAADAAGLALHRQLEEAQRERDQLRDAIRVHRDARGDDRCWMDDEALYGVLPEGYAPPVRDTAVELARCQQFIASRQNPATTYVSPQRRIDELESAEAAGLALRSRLQPYLQHKWECETVQFYFDAETKRLCTCGLDQALAEPPEQG